MLFKNKREIRDSSTKRPDTKFLEITILSKNRYMEHGNQTGQHSLNSKSSINYQETNKSGEDLPLKKFSQHPHRDIPCSPQAMHAGECQNSTHKKLNKTSEPPQRPNPWVWTLVIFIAQSSLLSKPVSRSLSPVLGLPAQSDFSPLFNTVCSAPADPSTGP